jgi:hypothetical protein
MDKLRPINGSCHCGNLRLILSWPESDSEIRVRECGCTFCQKHGGSWTSHRDSELGITISDQSLVSIYNFGTNAADFYVCSVCGVVPFVLSDIDDKKFAVVNINTFDNIDDFVLARSSTDFDGEDVGSRLERRKRNWISKVRLDE